MDSMAGKVDGLAGLVQEKWLAAMGLLGMILFTVSFAVPLPGDIVVARCVALIMMGYGFGQTECRTFRHRLGPGFILTGPFWRPTVTGTLMFALAAGAAIWLAAHLL